MSTNLHRRRLLGLFAAAPIAAAATCASPAALALGRLRPGFAGGRFAGAARSLAPALERALPLDVNVPASLTQIALGCESDAPAVLQRAEAEARAIATLALAYPPEIAAYRSFGAPMRRRLYAELLTRESVRLVPLDPSSPNAEASE